MVLHLAQAQAEGRGGVFAASLDKLEGGFVLGGGFDETGGAHAVGSATRPMARIMVASTRMFLSLTAETRTPLVGEVG